MNEDAEITEMARDENKEIVVELQELEDNIKMKLVPKGSWKIQKMLLVEVSLLEQEGMKLRFLLVIYSICITDTLLIKVGN